MTPSKIKKNIKVININPPQKTISADNYIEIYEKINVENSNFAIAGYQLYSISPQTARLTIRAIKINNTNNLYIYIQNSSSSQVTFYIAVDVLCFQTLIEID